MESRNISGGIEPSLFLAQHPPALERLAGALVRAGVRGKR